MSEYSSFLQVFAGSCQLLFRADLLLQDPLIIMSTDFLQDPLFQAFAPSQPPLLQDPLFQPSSQLTTCCRILCFTTGGTETDGWNRPPVFFFFEIQYLVIKCLWVIIFDLFVNSD